MYRVEIAASAEADLRAAYDWYLTNASEGVANRWKHVILEKAELLSSLPHRCAFAAEHFHHRLELRFIRCFSHLLIFTILKRRVIVLRIRHSSQNPLFPSEIKVE